MTTIRAELLQIGDTIMPPVREVRLWMRRALKERGLPESALYLTIVKITEGNPDKGGRWLLVESDHTPEWFGDGKAFTFTFKVRPETPWVKI